ncbi:MAG: hypothetical protein FWB90_02705 [Fibromonadales bacterium]|nr:hypothetical protein [Fibromonadales bacterium]
MFFSILAFILRKSFFEFLYPIYLLKFRKERDYIAERLKRANLGLVPKEVYKNLFFNGLDSLRFLQNKNVPVKFENRNLIPEEPVVFVSIHLGAFEMLHRGLIKLVESGEWRVESCVNLMVSEFRNKRLDNFLNSVRNVKNLNIVKDTRILKHIIRNKEILAVMADQSKFGAEYFDILGQSVPLFLKLPLTANKLGASVVLFRTFRQDDVHIIRIEKVYEPGSGVEAAEIAKIFESWILEYPEQWAWNYANK